MKKILLAIAALAIIGCDVSADQSPAAASRVTKASAEVVTQANGLTVEQENIKRRIEMENQPGTMKHLYIISAFSGDVILYSSVKGKVTSSGKRLTPTTVAATDGEFVYGEHTGFPVNFGGTVKRTGEVLQDDGSYGSSIEYLYWWDTQDRYHQHYVSGGQIVHVSDFPLAARKAIINVDAVK